MAYAAFTTSGTYLWTAPEGVTAVSVVCVGAGGGPAANTSGGGGAVNIFWPTADIVFPEGVPL